MKKLILLLVAQVSFFTYAQTVSYGNFKIGDQEIIYQKIFFEDSISISTLIEYYKTLPFVVDPVFTLDGLKFDIADIMVDYKKFGFAQVGTPSIIQTGKYYGKVSIGVKDGRYRVTLQAIQLTGDLGSRKIIAKDNLTTYSCRNSGTILSPDWCRPSMLGLLDKTFTDKLQFKKSKDDW